MRRSIHRKGFPSLGLLFATLIGGWGPQASGAVVINELMYHPPEDSDRLQYIELHNPSDMAVDLSGWSFEKGVRFEFPEQTVMEAGEFMVLCNDVENFQNHYGGAIAAIGNFEGRLSHKGETLRLVDDAGELVDAIEYGDAGAWPRGADGYGASLERITPTSSDKEASAWASSEMPEWKESRGTPGRRNDSYSAFSLPRIQGVEIVPQWPQVDERVRVKAKVSHAAGIQSVSLRYRVAQSRRESGTKALPMTLANGIASAEIPGLSAGSLVRLQIIVEGQDGATKIIPSDNAPRPALSYYVGNVPTLDRVGHGVLINVGEVERGVNKFHRARLGRDEREPTRGNSAFVYYPASEDRPLLYDFIRVTQRNGGFKLRFHADLPFDGMTVMNVLYEGNPRYLLSEYLAYELYRRAEVPAPQAGHLRITMDGREAGHFLTVEQPNRSFLKRNDRDANGNLYKILWFGRGVVDQHEKKTNRHEGHDDLLQVLAGLGRLGGAQQWRYIQQHFNVEEFASYFAVNMCLSNWDGFFNNYFTYHDTEDSGRWEIYPWDEDKTWGDYDGGPGDCSWYTFPLTSGMRGDRSPSRGLNFFNRGPFGGVSWWRPPGPFSGPLLANASFRKVFLARLEALCHSVFTEPQFGPVIDELEERLSPEVRHRARIRNRDPGRAEREFRAHIESFRQQVKHRRSFILRELAKN